MTFVVKKCWWKNVGKKRGTIYVTQLGLKDIKCIVKDFTKSSLSATPTNRWPSNFNLSSFSSFTAIFCKQWQVELLGRW